MKAIYELSAEHIQQLYEWHQLEWWSKDRRFDEVVRGVENSQLCVGLIDDDERLIGFTRVLTDFVFKAVLFDVIVERGHRDQGVGKKLMNLVLGHEALHAVKHFELYCLPEMEGYYTALGFSAEVGGVRLMRRNQP